MMISDAELPIAAMVDARVAASLSAGMMIDTVALARDGF